MNIITEAQELIINEEIARRDDARENIYKDKFEALKGSMYGALEEYSENLIKEVMGDNGFADLAQYRKFKPMIDAIIGIMKLNGLQVEEDKTPDIKFNEFGFPVADGQKQSGNEEILFADSDKNPAGVIVSDEYKGAIDDNKNLYNQVEDLRSQVEKMNEEYKRMEAKNYIFESLAGMQKDLVLEAVEALSSYTKEQLSENDDKVISDWLNEKKNGPDKFKGLTIENKDQKDAAEINSMHDQIERAKEILTEGSLPYGQRAAKNKETKEATDKKPITDFVIPGLNKKKVEIVPMSSMKDNLDPQIERAMSDLQRTNGSWRRQEKN